MNFRKFAEEVSQGVSQKFTISAVREGEFGGLLWRPPMGFGAKPRENVGTYTFFFFL